MYAAGDTERSYPGSPLPSYRSEFRRDYGRLVHCPAFRRLQGKTQLFPGQESDFFRNRLTHSLEVAQIAKTIAMKLNEELGENHGEGCRVDYDLIEFASLAHDLGHPPFGHLGEEALDEAMMAHGGFEGNAQTLRVLARLERRHLPDNTTLGIAPDGADRRQGLNLTYRALASVLKYDRTIPSDRAR
ncbi:MAG: dNTP triphosphohydrolase, partial [Chitinivibrionales bacterium]|nr:dNTP triphosphohydrolase [Chitinivibrionales bacterium]